MSRLQALRQHELLTRLLQLSRAQHDALLQERLDQFLALMGEREQIVDDLLANADQAPPPNVTVLPRAGPGASDRDLKASIGTLLCSVLNQDDENERVLREQLGDLVQALSRINLGYTTARGYAAALATAQVGRELDIAN
jgi:hypothetical protein